MLQRKVKLPQSQAEFDLLIEAFLVSNGFPNNRAYQNAVASMIQHLPNDQDYFYPKTMAAQMRRAKAGELAFYLIYPDKRPKEASEDVPTTTSPVVPQAQKSGV